VSTKVEQLGIVDHIDLIHHTTPTDGTPDLVGEQDVLAGSAASTVVWRRPPEWRVHLGRAG